MSISALAIRRISIDVKRVLEQPTDSGLFWLGDEADITHGWAIICGCEGTPYHGGAFCFEVNFPDNYPFEPPKFNYLTNDGRTRFNPNLYKNGKVCLSLLNTWQGEQWSGVQSLMSVLQSIQTAVMTEKPLMNEPAHPASTDPRHPEMPIYNNMVFHATLETAILGHLAAPPAYLVPVLEPVRAWFVKAREPLIKKARELAAEFDGKVGHVPFYTMSTKFKFAELADRLAAL
jgi:ubiquitin-protein ligase